jgi:hypothetical protein
LCGREKETIITLSTRRVSRMYTRRTRSQISPELRKILESNPNVDHVTDYEVYYTQAFKDEFWEEYSTNHTAPNEIFRRHGFDVDRLGYWRSVGLVRNLIRAHKPEIDTEKASREAKGGSSEKSSRKDMQRLEHKIELLSQQLEFIKKTIALGRKEKQQK